MDQDMVRVMGMGMREGEQPILTHRSVRFTVVLQIGQNMSPLLLTFLHLQVQEERYSYIGHASTTTLTEPEVRLHITLHLLLETRAMYLVPPDTEAIYTTLDPRDILVLEPRTAIKTPTIPVTLTKSHAEDMATHLPCHLHPTPVSKSHRQRHISMKMALK